ncbi:DUF1573 domain-containing protein [Candidatus Pyrohabitans sp.]
MVKKKSRKKKGKAKQKKSNIRVYAILAALLLIGAGFYLLKSQETEEVIEGTPIMVISPESHDFGMVSVRGGEVSTSFVVENRGDGDLVISDMETSCACTSATIEYRGKEGPRFNMREHGTNPKGWSQRIHPGEKAYLKVYYSPRVHPDIRGEVIRFVTLYTNDPQNQVAKVYIRVVQVG